jgi:hypothetical protein
MSLDSRYMLLCWMCSTITDWLCATRSGCVPLDNSCVILWIDTIVFYWMALL